MKRRTLLGLIVLCISFILLQVILCTLPSITKEESEGEKKITVFSAYVPWPGQKIDEENDIAEKIAELTGVKVDIQWTKNNSLEADIKRMVAYQQYPDYINGGTYIPRLIHENALIPLEDYIPKYKNLSNYLTKEEWELFRTQDGHIYVIPQRQKIDPQCFSYPIDMVFYIQFDVLKWAGYPEIHTLQEYFDLIERYQKAYPEIDGNKTIGFLMDCEDFRCTSLFNVPQVLAGKTFNTIGIFKDRLQLLDMIPEAKEYYRTLNVQYNKGIIAPESFTMTYEEYSDMLKKGCVLGVFDQFDEVSLSQSYLAMNGKYERTMIPIELSLSEDQKVSYAVANNYVSWDAIGISRSCKDVEKALQFLDDLLSQEVLELRFWGEKDVDYSVDKDGKFMQTERQRLDHMNPELRKKHFCTYAQFPKLSNYMPDGINCVYPMNQPTNVKSRQVKEVRELLNAYQHENLNQFLSYESIDCKDNYTMTEFMRDYVENGEMGRLLVNTNTLKRKWLPSLVMAGEGDFEELWRQYEAEYNKNFSEDRVEGVRRGVRKKGIQH